MGIRRRLTGMLALLGALLPSILYAQPAPLEPSTPWKVDYADSECRLLRTFGSGDRAITLRLARGGNPGRVDVILAGPGIPKLPRTLPLEMRLDPQNLAQSAKAMSTAIPSGGGHFIRWFDGSFALFDHFGDNQIVQFSSGQTFAARLDVTSARAALKAFDACYVDLLVSWGASPEDAVGLAAARTIPSDGNSEVVAQRADLPAIKGSPLAWVTPADYPTDALMKEQSGDVIVMLEVASNGRPTACRIAVSSKVDSLDQTTCRLLQSRARYAAPLDKTGQPRRSIRFERMRWSVPKD